MNEDEQKPVKIDFRAGGIKYRAEEWSNKMGVTITNLATNDTAFDLWPENAQEKYGSKLMVNLTIELFQSVSNGMKYLSVINGSEPKKANEHKDR